MASDFADVDVGDMCLFGEEDGGAEADTWMKSLLNFDTCINDNNNVFHDCVVQDDVLDTIDPIINTPSTTIDGAMVTPPQPPQSRPQDELDFSLSCLGKQQQSILDSAAAEGCRLLFEEPEMFDTLCCPDVDLQDPNTNGSGDRSIGGTFSPSRHDPETDSQEKSNSYINDSSAEKEDESRRNSNTNSAESGNRKKYHKSTVLEQNHHADASRRNSTSPSPSETFSPSPESSGKMSKCEEFSEHQDHSYDQDRLSGGENDGDVQRRREEKSHMNTFDVDGNGDTEEKKKARLQRNRESAHLSRQRKKAYVDELEQRNQMLQRTITELHSLVGRVTVENTALRKQLAYIYEQMGLQAVPQTAPGPAAPTAAPTAPPRRLKTQSNNNSKKKNSAPHSIPASPDRAQAAITIAASPNEKTSSAPSVSLKRKAEQERGQLRAHAGAMNTTTAKNRRTTTIGSVAALATLSCMMLVSVPTSFFSKQVTESHSALPLPHGERRSLLSIPSMTLETTEPTHHLAFNTDNNNNNNNNKYNTNDYTNGNVEALTEAIDTLSMESVEYGPHYQQQEEGDQQKVVFHPVTVANETETESETTFYEIKLPRRVPRKELPSPSSENALAVRTEAVNSNRNNNDIDIIETLQANDLPEPRLSMNQYDGSAPRPMPDLFSLLNPVMCVKVLSFDVLQEQPLPSNELKHIRDFIMQSSGRALLEKKNGDVVGGTDDDMEVQHNIYRSQQKLSLPAGSSASDDIAFSDQQQQQQQRQQQQQTIDDVREEMYNKMNETDTAGNNNNNNNNVFMDSDSNEQMISLLVPSSSKDIRQVYVVTLSEMSKYITYSCKLPSIQASSSSGWNKFWNLSL